MKHAMTPKTAAALAEIEKAVAAGQRLIDPAIFSHIYGRAATAAAFRMARARGIIEVAYKSCVGTPVYQPAGIEAAMHECRSATLH